MSKRRQVRERVLQALYAQELSGDTPEHVIATILQPTFESDRVLFRFAEKLFLRALDARYEADALIERHVKNWELGRLALTDRLVLRMAVGELLYFEDVPPKVTINEALEVARAFSTDRSASFVNGVLDAILHDLRAADRLHKTGRGLVGVLPDARPESSEVEATPVEAPVTRRPRVMRPARLPVVPSDGAAAPAEAATAQPDKPARKAPAPRTAKPPAKRKEGAGPKGAAKTGTAAARKSGPKATGASGARAKSAPKPTGAPRLKAAPQPKAAAKPKAATKPVTASKSKAAEAKPKAPAKTRARAAGVPAETTTEL